MICFEKYLRVSSLPTILITLNSSIIKALGTVWAILFNITINFTVIINLSQEDVHHYYRNGKKIDQKKGIDFKLPTSSYTSRYTFSCMIQNIKFLNIVLVHYISHFVSLLSI